MLKLTFSLIAMLFLSMSGIAQMVLSDEHYRMFDGQGRGVTLDEVVRAAAANDVVFLGEMHDDAVGHAFQLELFTRLVERHAEDRRVALSLEMFERDVQIVLDEYLKGLISESHFLLSSRPWGNYKSDYRSLVELAKSKNLAVIAANAPRRYVNMVSRGGRTSLGALTREAKAWLAPLPFAEPSEAYSKKFKALMGPSAEATMGLDRILASQSLWDATMAHSVAGYLDKNKKALVVHLNGGFHSEGRLGAVEHLRKYRPKTKVLVVTIKYEDEFMNFDPTKHAGSGDIVVLTDAGQPRSKR